MRVCSLFCGIGGIDLAFKLGQNVESISYQAFLGCSNLTKAIFINPNGWTVAPVLSSGYAISSEQLSDTSKAAAYLRTTYETYSWKRI